MRWAALLTLSASVAAAGPGLDAAYARRLVHAKTTREADRLRARYDDARVAALACRFQLARGLAPIACYEALAHEASWGIGRPAARAATRAELDRRCARAAAALEVPEADHALRFVSRRCAERVRDGRAVRRYRDEDAAAWSGD